MIRAAFLEIGKKVTTDTLYQWDVNQILEITGSDLVTAPPFHFANKNHEEAVVVQSEIVDGLIRVPIPNTLLAEQYPIYAFLVIVEGDVLNTKQVFEIPIIPRPMPADYHFIDDKDVINYEYLMDKVVRFGDRVENLTLIVGALNANSMSNVLGMYNKQTLFLPDGSIVETGDGWTKTTVFLESGNIQETMRTIGDDGKTQVTVKETVFNDDGSITEQITESYTEEVEA